MLLLIQALVGCTGGEIDCGVGTTFINGECRPILDSNEESDTDTDTDTDTDADSDADTDSDTDTDATSVSDVQQGGATGVVTLAGVVATTETANNHFFVQDEGGGEWSGLDIYLGGVEVAVSRGDVLTLTGEVGEYNDNTQIVVADAGDVSVTGSGSASADVIAATPSSWENYEGGLVTLEGVTVGEPNEYGEAETQ
jgi:predicted extracellular nuclease